MDPATSRTRIPVIIDTDPGVDDIIAILLALASPELDILAFIISFGNTDIDAAHLNILKAYQAISRHLEKHPEDIKRFPNFASGKKVVLAKGCDGPIEGELHSAKYFHGRDGLSGITERHPDLNVDCDLTQGHPQLEISQTRGVDVVLTLLRSYPSRSITYIVLGPMTNLVQMMKEDGDMIRDRIGRIVSMGGTLDVPGNTTPVAEFNFFADPYAVKQLLLDEDSGLQLPLDRFLMVPLDTTTPHELPFFLYKQLVDLSFESASVAPSSSYNKSPMTHFTSSFLERTREVMLSFGKDAMELHDVVVMWLVMENPPLPDGEVYPNTLAPGWNALRRIFDIERTGELTRGMLVVDRRDDQTAYAPGANRAEVQRRLELFGISHRPWESTAVPAQVALEQEPQVSTNRAGVWCVTETPGPKALLRLLLSRVWGVETDT